jgi:UDP-GlcNAc:undecaprenyl-phosphate GlcNAc-1-phosphate transferase
MRDIVWMAGKTFLIALILTPIIRDIFRLHNVVDRPGQRKVHKYPIPRIGGVAIAVAYGACLLWSSPDSDFGRIAEKVLPSAAMVFLVGLCDDLFSISPRLKLLGVLAAASLAFWNGLGIGTLGQYPIPWWLDFVATTAWLLLTSNALNLIDGLDGLCGGIAFLASLTLFVAASLQGQLPLAAATLPLAAALLGFLCYNINPATVFLGDSGALLIGFLLGCFGIMWVRTASTLFGMLLPILALSVPLLDVFLSVLRRVLRKRPIFSADANHIHHRLLNRGLPARKVAWVLHLSAAWISALALFAGSPQLSRYQAAFLILYCVTFIWAVWKLGYAEFGIASRLVVNGAFQRNLNAELTLSETARALTLADTDDGRWEALVQGARKSGVTAIRWTGAQPDRHAVLIDDGAPKWSLHIPLSSTDAIEIEGAFSVTARSCNLIGFAQVVSQNLPAKQRLGGKVLSAAASV